MARTVVVAPPRNDVYVAMLGLAAGAIAFSCLLLGLEVSGYEEVKPFQAANLPKLEPRPAPTGGTPAGGAPAGPGGSAKVEPTTPPPAAVAKSEPPKVETPPLPAVPPVVAKAEPPKVETPKVPDPNRGPRPGFNLFAPPAAPPK